MPQLKAVKSLSALCVDSIVYHMTDYSHWWECIGPKPWESPFVSLPLILLDQIYGVVKDHWGFIRTQEMDIFVVPQLNTLDCDCLIRSQNKHEIRSLIRLLHQVTRICPGLKVLKWTGLKEIGLPLFQAFLPMFHNLQELHISGTSAGDSCLYVIGTFCEDLQYLDVERCPVTDDGINGLCFCSDSSRKREENAGKCKAIHTLKMKKTKITKAGVQTALDNLPALKTFEFNSYVQILAELYKAAERTSPDIPTYPFTHLQWNDEFQDIKNSGYDIPYIIGGLQLVASMCPFVTSVQIIEEVGVTDTELRGLLVLKNLRELCIIGGKDGITFDGGIVPLLKTFGNSLMLLKLKELDDYVNARAIFEYCSNLISLSLVNNFGYKSDWLEDESQPFCSKRMRKEPILNNLKSLHLSCSTEDNEFSAEHLLWFLASPQLVKMRINFCRELTDDILQQSVNLHHFGHLEHLNIFNSYNVTKKGIDLFMTANNPLKEIHLIQCAELKTEHADEWDNLIEEKNWEVNFTFREYS